MGSKLVAIKTYFKGTALGTYLRRRRWNAQLLDVNGITKIVDKNTQGISAEEKKAIIEDILEMARKYRFCADEYFYYHFREKTEEERKEFCSDLNRIDIVESLNKAKNLVIFNDKMRTYEYYKQYYGRDFCGVKGIGDVAALRTFVQKHLRFILKPTDSSCGHGIMIVDLAQCGDVEAKLQELIHTYCTGGKDGFVAEELIVQDAHMASLHPSSVNTIRITTIRCDDGVEILPSFVKAGRDGKNVDNGGAGGLLGAIDMETGRVLAVADKYGTAYTTHPTTGVDLIGFQIPRWEEAKTLAAELAMVIPENRYTGWDLALTEKGWVMVEGNARGQFIGWQISLQKGYLREINRILRRLGRKELTKTGI